MSENGRPTSEAQLEAAFEELEQTRPQSGESAGSGIAGMLALILALIAIGISSYAAYESFGNAETVPEADRVRELTASLTTMEQTQQARFAELEQLLASLPTQEGVTPAALETLATRIENDLSDIRSRLSTSSEDWLFAEVEYLVRMANQRVLMEQDPDAALHLLLSADRIVRDAEGIAAHELRAALADDIAALQAVSAPDVQGLYLEISAQIRQVSALERKLPAYQAPMAQTEAPPAAEGFLAEIATLARSAFGRLGQLLDFRRGGVEIKPVLPPEQQYYLRQNLILKLQIAQMALLEGEAEVYRVTLIEAGQWVEESFDNNKAAEAMRASLTRLASEDVGIDLPDISASLDAARQLLSDFHRSEAE
ncbi:MAG: uroporphyrinogen-III C-methyltransferase [Pseudomonadales bacterium]